jgi:GWxTD domain-containing protein
VSFSDDLIEERVVGPPWRNDDRIARIETAGAFRRANVSVTLAILNSKSTQSTQSKGASMKTRHLIGVAILCFATVAATAGGLSKYKGWDKTPQGYLMTAAERAQWASVKTDDEADKFVKDFLARRSPDFADQVNFAAAQADKYFTTGKTPGSRTERGRLVIILGPPSAMSKTDSPVRGALRTPTGGAMTNMNEGGGGENSAGASVDDYASAANNAGAGDSMLHTYSFTYDASRLPPKFGGALDLVIAVDPGGRERIDRKAQDRLDTAYEMAAQSKIIQPASR